MGKSDDKVKALLEQAEQGTRAVFESDKYRNYLATMAKFHSYSFRNTLLILMQKPEATYVAGYAAWQKKFKRQVQRGQKGIQIIGYTPRKIEVEQEKKDQKGKLVIGTDGKPEIEKVSKQIPSFTPVYVYDVSQTEGEPLPQLVNELEGRVEGYQHLLKAVREVSPFPITFENIPGGARGYCSPLEQKIVVQEGMSEVQNIKTIIHEVTHAALHAPEIDLPVIERTDRNTKEVEAESTAFIVCSHYGIDTSEYTFPYLASWSNTKELNELQSSLETIQKQASELIDKIDTRLAELQMERPKELLSEKTACFNNDIHNKRLILRDFLNSHRGANISAMTQGGYLYLSAEQTQNYENLSSVSSHLGESGSKYDRVFDDELLNATVQVGEYNETFNNYALLIDEFEGIQIRREQEQTPAEKMSMKERMAVAQAEAERLNKSRISTEVQHNKERGEL